MKHYCYSLVYRTNEANYTSILPYKFDDLSEVFNAAYEAEEKENPEINRIYTIWKCETNRNDPKELNYFYLDMDKIVRNDIAKYIHAIAGILNVDYEDIGVLDSGRGLQIFLELDYPIKIEDYDYWRKVFKSVCDKIHTHCKRFSLPYEKDSCYDKKRLLRVPNTINYNPNKEPNYARSRIINPTIGRIKRDELERLADLGREDVSNPVGTNSKSNKHFKDKKCISFLWNNRPHKGRRHNTLLRLISHEIKSGISLESLESKLDTFCDRFDIPKEDVKLMLHDIWKRCENDQEYDFGCKDDILSSVCTKECKIHPEHKKNPFENTESKQKELQMHIAERLVESFLSIKHTDGEPISKGIFYFHNGKSYEEIKLPVIIRKIKEITDWPMAKIRNQLEDILFALEKIQPTGCILNAKNFFAKSHYINCNNGILDLKTMELKPHNPDFNFFYCLDIDYDPTKTETPLFDKFLETTTGGDFKKQELLKEILSVPLFQDQVEKMFWLYGPSGTGKSTFVGVLENLYSTKNTSHLSLGEINGRFFGTLLIGKLLNISTEGLSKKYNSDTIKKIISNETIIIDIKNKTAVDTKIKAKLFFVYNDRPEFSETSGAVSRRLLQVLFEKVVAPDKAELDYHRALIKKEGSAILNVALEYYSKLSKNNLKFTETKESDSLNDEVRAAGDPIYDFQQEFIMQTPDEDALIPITGLYEGFTNFMNRERKKDKMPTRAKFKAVLREQLELAQTTRREVYWLSSAATRSVCFVGINLINEEEYRERCH